EETSKGCNRRVIRTQAGEYPPHGTTGKLRRTTRLVYNLNVHHCTRTMCWKVYWRYVRILPDCKGTTDCAKLLVGDQLQTRIWECLFLLHGVDKTLKLLGFVKLN